MIPKGRVRLNIFDNEAEARDAIAYDTARYNAATGADVEKIAEPLQRDGKYCFPPCPFSDRVYKTILV
jgi:hypothetical protein